MTMPSTSPGVLIDHDHARFTVWAQGRQRVELEIEGRGLFPMQAVGEGYFTLALGGVAEGTRYGYHIDGGPRLPDLASRRQSGTDGDWSCVTSNAFAWTDQAWRGLSRFDQVIYQLHIGTFTVPGTWTAAIERLDHLRSLGVTAIQLMPVGSFKGRFGWGYDTILPYAPFAP